MAGAGAGAKGEGWQRKQGRPRRQAGWWQGREGLRTAEGGLWVGRLAVGEGLLVVAKGRWRWCGGAMKSSGCTVHAHSATPGSRGCKVRVCSLPHPAYNRACAPVCICACPVWAVWDCMSRCMKAHVHALYIRVRMCTQHLDAHRHRGEGGGTKGGRERGQRVQESEAQSGAPRYLGLTCC